MSHAVQRTRPRELKSIAAAVRREHDAAQGAFRSAVEHAIRCGELLIEAKAEIGHGGWGDWLEENFPASGRTARGYMRLARHGDELNRQGLAELGIEGALKQLAAPRREPEVHWALDLIPPMTDQEREDFDASIAEHGCLVPIAYADEGGVLLDGRERLRACREAGIKPPSITYRGLSDAEQAEYVFSLNLIRGDYSEGRIVGAFEDRLEAAGDDRRAIEALVDDLDRIAPVAARVSLRAKRRYGELLEEAT